MNECLRGGEGNGEDGGAVLDTKTVMKRGMDVI